MRKIKLFALCALMLFVMSLTACKSDDVTAVEKKIDAIGEVSENSLDVILSARNAFEQLGEQDRKSVSNYFALEAAEEKYDVICANSVDLLIQQIGNIDDNSSLSICKAREAYDALTKRQKSLVTQYRTLIEAEKQYSEYIIQRATEAIAALETADPDDTDKYEAAEKLFNMLSDEEKEQVSRNISSIPDPIQAARIGRASKLIERITYTKGTPTTEELSQLLTAANAYLELSLTARAEVSNVAILKNALKEFVVFVDSREKTDKLFARSEFLKRCEAIDYEDLLTYPKSYKDREISVDIQIDAIEEGLFATEIIAHIPGTELPFSLKDERNIKEPAFNTGDIFTIYGVFCGTKTVTIKEEGSGWFGTELFGEVNEKYDVPIVRIIYTSTDNLGVIATGDPSARVELDLQKEKDIEWLTEAAKQIGLD